MDKTNNKEVRIVRLRRRKKEEKKPQPQRSAASEALTVVLVVLAVFLLLSLASYYRTRSLELPLGENLMGVVGARAARILTAALGWCSFVTVLWAALLSRSIWLGMKKPEGGWAYRTALTGTGSLAMALSCAMGASVFWGMEGGGRLGVMFESRVHPYVNTAGTLLIASLMFILSLGVATGLTISDVIKTLRVGGQWFGKTLVGSWLLSSRAGKIFFRTNVVAGKTALKMTGATARVMGRAVIAGARRAPQLKRKRRKEEAAKEKAAQKFLPVPVQANSSHADAVDAVVVETAGTRASFDEKELRILRSGEEDAAARKTRFPLGRKRLKALKAKKDEKKKTEAEQFALPPVDFLVKADAAAPTAPKDDEIIRNCRQLERALTDFHIGGKIVEVQPGPVITLYQFEPAPGIKVNRIVNLADDLALALKTASVRVYAPVPGKGTVGIEVPNVHREVVRLRDILDCQKFSSAESALTLALGKDTFGEPFVADLAKMPHLLIAGATGTGKSVCINSLLLSLLYRSTPDDLRLILIDPKMLELSVYEEIPHLKAPVVTDPKHARGVFWWAVEEMERRYRMMAEFGVRSIEGYNKLAASADGAEKLIIRTPRAKVIELEERDVVAMASSDGSDGIARESGDYTDEPIKKGLPAAGAVLPRIVIVVDELADLMLTSGRECEDLVTRLAQKARAAGIHLILATQRPSVNVITGLIKANFPSRISFKVASRIDSRTVLDSSGAEKLLGQGDMLFMTSGAGRAKRVHSAFVSDKEVHDVVKWLREQGAPDYDPQIEEMIARMEETEKSAGIGGDEEAEYDPLYDQAVNLVVEKGQASTSMVQRVFRIGYNRAARILETMEREGVVGPADGAKPRQVLVPHRDGLA